MGHSPARVTGAVLTGGRSRRMGRDKAQVIVAGRALVTVAADALWGAGADPVLAVGGDGAVLGRLGLVPVPDAHPGAGPLGGLLSALAAAPGEVVVVLACDLPAVTAEGVRRVVDALDRAPEAAAAVPVAAGRRHALHAAWRRSSALPAVRAVLAAGERALHGALDAMVTVPVGGLDPAWLADVDTPADLANLRLGRSGVQGPDWGP
ncbi:MAG: molybdenum cofactor guanylyltransferase [Acidimicrobiales bacterium]